MWVAGNTALSKAGPALSVLTEKRPEGRESPGGLVYAVLALPALWCNVEICYISKDVPEGLRDRHRVPAPSSSYSKHLLN